MAIPPYSTTMDDGKEIATNTHHNGQSSTHLYGNRYCHRMAMPKNESNFSKTLSIMALASHHAREWANGPSKHNYVMKCLPLRESNVREAILLCSVAEGNDAVDLWRWISFRGFTTGKS